jgi:hypothetical protein
MAGFLIRMLITSLGLWVASAIVPGLEIQGFGTLLGSALLLGLVNAVVRPVIVLLTLPITIVRDSGRSPLGRKWKSITKVRLLSSGVSRLCHP